MAAARLAALRPSWQQTMLRVKDPAKSLGFYCGLMGMTLVDKCQFPDMKFDLYFLASFPKGQEYKHEPGSVEAHKFLWSTDLVTLELTHNYGTEADDSKYHTGNQERDGFGHVCFNCPDVYAAADKLVEKGVEFKKKPDEGRMKGIAFAYDPDGYWVELVSRSEKCTIENEYNLSQTMLRIKDPAKTLPFYQSLGLTLIREVHFDSFSLYFLTNLLGRPVPGETTSDEARLFTKDEFPPVLELTHNHGTEKDDDFQHFNGNEADRKGFGHIGFLVDDVDEACAALSEFGYGFVKQPNDGKMKGLAFAKDPDGYWVEIIKRGGYDDEATPYKK